jgi:2,3-bisphosphoglycerate-dependent phosphoglycerate mutase
MTAAGHRQVSPIVYLVRHCEATGQGQEPGAPLSEVGFRQAEQLADWFADREVARIVSSPYTRAFQTVEPLAKRRGLVIETDDRFRERALCSGPLPDWRERVAASYSDLDLCLPGGESCRTAMARGVAALEDVIGHGLFPAVVATHGNLLALLRKHFDASVGFDEWQRLSNPDVYCLRYDEGVPSVVRLWLAEACPFP